MSYIRLTLLKKTSIISIHSTTLCTVEEELHNGDAINIVKVGVSVMFHAKAQAYVWAKSEHYETCFNVHPPFLF
jgi:hypothetical protein